MALNIDHNYFNKIQTSYPPLLETFAVKKDPNLWGLNSEGRTVCWMKNVQATVMSIFSNVIGLAGLILGVIAGTAHAIVSRDSKLIEKTANQGAEYGNLAGLHIGAITGSAISSIIAPPASGLANLLFKLREKTSSTVEDKPLFDSQDDEGKLCAATIGSDSSGSDFLDDIEGIPRGHSSLYG